MKTFNQHLITLSERRSHPELNQKISINEIIRNAVKNTKSKIADIQNLFISMTNKIRGSDDTLDVGYELNLNVKSSYNTPLGIYCYPASYVARRIGTDKKLEDSLPYQGQMPYVNIFSVKGNIINLATMTDSEYASYAPKLKTILEKNFGATKENAETVVDNVYGTASKNARVKTPGGKFWYLLYKISNELSQERRLSSSSIVLWNKLFMHLGINGCVDPKGQKIIHPNEPTQAVFFNTNAIAKNTRYDNKYSLPQVSFGLLNKLNKLGAKNMTDDELISIIKGGKSSNVVEDIYIEDVSEKVQLALFSSVDIRDILRNNNTLSANVLTPKAFDTIIKYDPLSITIFERVTQYRQKYGTLITSDIIKKAANEALKTYKDTKFGPSTKQRHMNDSLKSLTFFQMVKDVDKDLFNQLADKFPKAYSDIRNDIR